MLNLIEHVAKGGEVICKSSKKTRFTFLSALAAIVGLFQLIFWKEYFKPESAARSHNLAVAMTVTLFFGAVLAFAAFIFIRHRVYFLIDSEGIKLVKVNQAIFWRDVRNIFVRQDLWKHTYMDLELHEPAGNLRTCTLARHRGRIPIMVTGLNHPAKDLLNLAGWCLAKAREKATKPD